MSVQSSSSCDSFDLLSLPLPWRRSRSHPPRAIIMHALGYPTPRICLWRLFFVGVSAHFLVLQMCRDTFVAHMNSPLSAAEVTMFKRFCPQGLAWWSQMKQRVAAAPARQSDGPLILELVSPCQTAWHAGVSTFGQLPRVGQSLNASTIGIEMHMPGYDGCYRWSKTTASQDAALVGLLKQLCQQWSIDPRLILAHGSVSPNRRTDPGAGFSFQNLHRAGFGYQPPLGTRGCEIFSWDQAPQLGLERTDVADKISQAQKWLAQIGFDCPQTGRWDWQSQYCLNAYRLQFYPWGPLVPLRLEIEGLAKTRVVPDVASLTPGVLAALKVQAQDKAYPTLLRPASQARS